MTMREEFEAHRVRNIKSAGIRQMVLKRAGDSYLHLQVEQQWRDWKAAYAAGQKTEREACAAACDSIAKSYGMEPGSYEYGECADAIRNRTNE